MTDGQAGTLDGVALALLESRLNSVVRKMANTLIRTARSPTLNTARDFSCCLITADSELLTTVESLPIHAFAGPDIMHAYMKQVHPDLRRGDAILNNSPYHGNNHAADWVVFVPVFDSSGRHRYTAMAKAHLADIGNCLPTTINPMAKDVYDEGALIFPAVRVQRDYAYVDDIIRMCEVRLRELDVWRGDFDAIIGAARIGERELELIGNEFGWDALDTYVDQWFDYCEGRMVDVISQMPEATATATTTHDAFETCPEIPVTAKLSVQPKDATITVDLRDNMDSLPNGMNLSEASSLTAAYAGVFLGLPRPVPPNAGSMRRVEVLLRDGCIVGIPRHPASCSASTTNVTDRTINAVQLAMGKLADGFGMAEIGAGIPACTGNFVISDVDGNEPPELGATLIGGTAGAATPSTDGWLTTMTAACAGTVGRGVTEILELTYPMYIWVDEIDTDSEGPGRTRGAPSAHVEMSPKGNRRMDMYWFGDGTKHGAQGVAGGGDGRPANQGIAVDGVFEQHPGFGPVSIGSGERLVSYSASGGGYGDPFERDVESVLDDVVNGWITAERAADVYGVRVTAELTVDLDATRARRGGSRSEGS